MTPKDELNQLALAANSIQTAIDALEKVTRGGQYAPWDALHYTEELNQVLKGKHDKVGLNALIALVSRKVQS